MDRIVDKNILVTGGAGFIGSNLIRRLAENNNVISLDNYFSGSKSNHITDVKYYEDSTLNIDKYDFCNPDIVFHFGEYARVEQSLLERKTVFELNTIGTQRVVEFCLKHGSKLIYAGSSTKFAEADNPTHMTPYNFSKATNTEYIQAMALWTNLDYATVYFYNAYGPNEISEGKYATLIGKFIRLYQQGEALTVRLPGTQKRNFTHVEDICDALELVALHGSGDGYGIGADESYSILDIAKMFNSEIKYIPEAKGNRKNGKLITDKTKLLGWRPKRNITNYIEEQLRGA